MTDQTATPEPDWLARLRDRMDDEITAAIGERDLPAAATDVQAIADRATGVAASLLRSLHAELDAAREEYEGTETRRVELEADVRALGGDPDRMVDCRDHEAAIEAMREAMQPDQTGPHIIDRIAVDRARDIAEEHMLRMAQGAMGASAPEVREVPTPDPEGGDDDDFAGNLRARVRCALAEEAGPFITRLLPVADVATRVALDVARPLLENMTRTSEEHARLVSQCAKPAQDPETAVSSAGPPGKPGRATR